MSDSATLPLRTRRGLLVAAAVVALAAGAAGAAPATAVGGVPSFDGLRTNLVSYGFVLADVHAALEKLPAMPADRIAQIDKQLATGAMDW